MKIDWDRRTCARKGHATYAPDDPRLRIRLHADTALGEVWRCLRCGDFVLGEPHGSGPAAEAPLVPRGKVLRDLFILRFLAIERAVRGVFIVLVAVAVWKFSNSQDSVRRLFDEYLDVFRPVFRHFHYDLDHSPIVGIDRFMSEARALTNFAGNAVATVLVGTWTKEIDKVRVRQVLAGELPFDETTLLDEDVQPHAEIPEQGGEKELAKA